MGSLPMSLPRQALLSEEETKKLLLLARNGDFSARDKLVQANLRLVYSVSQRFLNRGKELDDLFQVGSIGLLKAIDKFDPSYDVRFSTYAVPMIMGEIRRHFRDDNSIRVSRSVKDTARRVMQEKEKLVIKLQRDPTIDEIASSLDISREEIIFAMDAVSDPVSLQETIYSTDDDVCLEDRIEDNDDEDECLDHLVLEEMLDTLKDGERQVLTLRFFSDKTQTEVAEILKISQAQVSRLEKGAINKIRNRMK